MEISEFRVTVNYIRHKAKGGKQGSDPMNWHVVSLDQYSWEDLSAFSIKERDS